MSPRLFGLLAALSGLCGCAPFPERYLNSVHPEYGAAQFVADLGLCRDGASTEVVTTLGVYYPPQSDPCSRSCGRRPKFRPSFNNLRQADLGRVPKPRRPPGAPLRR